MTEQARKHEVGHSGLAVQLTTAISTARAGHGIASAWNQGDKSDMPGPACQVNQRYAGIK